MKSSQISMKQANIKKCQQSNKEIKWKKLRRQKIIKYLWIVMYGTSFSCSWSSWTIVSSASFSLYCSLTHTLFLPTVWVGFKPPADLRLGSSDFRVFRWVLGGWVRRWRWAVCCSEISVEDYSAWVHFERFGGGVVKVSGNWWSLKIWLMNGLVCLDLG